MARREKRRHGLSQYTTPFSDGTPLASQWPIPPYGFFDYEFSLSSPSSSIGAGGEPSIGTYFYHSHVGMQAMSAFGPIVIEPPSEKEEAKKAIPVEWDEDLIMMLSDGYHVSIVSPGTSVGSWRYLCGLFQ